MDLLRKQTNKKKLVPWYLQVQKPPCNGLIIGPQTCPLREVRPADLNIKLVHASG